MSPPRIKSTYLNLHHSHPSHYVFLILDEKYIRSYFSIRIPISNNSLKSLETRDFRIWDLITLVLGGSHITTTLIEFFCKELPFDDGFESSTPLLYSKLSECHKKWNSESVLRSRRNLIFF